MTAALPRPAKYRNQSMLRWVTDVLKLYLAGGSSRFVGTCDVCKRRAALSAPVKKAKAMMMEDEAQSQAEVKSEASEEAPRKCRHALQRHPGCLKADFSGHAHGPWWPRSEGSDDACRPSAVRLEELRRKMQAESLDG